MEEVYQRNRQNSGQPRNMKSLRSGNSSHDTKQGVMLLEPGRVTVQGTEDSSDARSPLPNKRPKVAAPSLQAPPSTSRATPQSKSEHQDPEGACSEEQVLFWGNSASTPKLMMIAL
jgi:hypothetical protein